MITFFGSEPAKRKPERSVGARKAITTIEYRERAQDQNEDAHQVDAAHPLPVHFIEEFERGELDLFDAPAIQAGG
jgi:hypothetical protein